MSNAVSEVNGESLLGQGIAAAKDGRKQQAITIFIKVVRQDKGNLEAWLWLARLLDDPVGRRKCLQMVQQLDPANLEARYLLAELDRPPVFPPSPPPEPAGIRPEPARPPIAAPARRAARTKPAYKILAFCLASITGLACLAVVAVAIWWGYRQSQLASSVPGLVIATSTPAYSPGGLKNIFVEYILDGSNSMNDKLPDGISKAAAAKKNLATSLTSYRPETSVGLRVFGENVPASNQKESCQDIQLVAPVAPGEMGQIMSWLAGDRPQGMTPIAAVLQQAAGDFVVGEDRVNSIVLISDGQETCGGDPCALVKQLEGQGLRFSLHVIGLNVDEDTRQQLSCIAQAGGGLYLEAHTSQELKDALDQVQQRIVQDARATPVPANPAILSPTVLPTATAILTATPPSLTVDMLKNGTYFLPNPQKTFKLVNGIYSEGSGLLDQYTVGMQNEVAFGDLNGDGVNDAAVLLAENTGGSGVFVSVVAILNVNGTPSQAGQAEIGDKVQVNSMAIDSDAIMLDTVVHGPNDPECCVSQPETQTFRLIGKTLWLTRLTSRSSPDAQERSININTPVDGASVTNPFTINGSVTVAPSENMLAYQVYLPDGTKVDESTLTVESGGNAGGPGTFSQTFDLSNAGITGPVIIQFLDVSAADGLNGSTTLALGSVRVNVH